MDNGRIAPSSSSESCGVARAARPSTIVAIDLLLASASVAVRRNHCCSDGCHSNADEYCQRMTSTAAAAAAAAVITTTSAAATSCMSATLRLVNKDGHLGLDEMLLLDSEATGSAWKTSQAATSCWEDPVALKNKLSATATATDKVK